MRVPPRFGTHLFTLACPLLALGACSAGSGFSGTTETDSAGVRIVETQQFVWDQGEEWSISPEPLLQLGQRDGPEALQFFQVSDARRLPDGRIVVVNSGSGSIRVFSEEGAFLTEFGSTGEGPEEFKRLSSVHHLGGDTLLAWDVGRPGFSLFTIQGEHLQTQLLRPVGTERPWQLFTLGDGRLVLSTFRSILTDGEDAGLGIHRREAPIFLLSANGEVLDTVGVFPGPETMVMDFGGNTGVGPPPFLKNAYAGVEDGRVYVGTAESLEVLALDPTRGVEAIYRYPSLHLTVSESDETWYKDQMTQMAATPEERQLLPVILPAIIFPETRAAFSDLKVSGDGAIWLRTGRHIDVRAASPEWTVIEESGAFLGTVTMPDRFEPMEFGPDYVLGAWKDDLDVEFVRLYALVK